MINMKHFKYLLVISILLILNSCNGQTSTPEEFLNSNKIDSKIYKNNRMTFKKSSLSYLDSLNNSKTPKPKSDILNINIDTVFYGPNGKVAILYILKKTNPYVELVNQDNEGGIQYSGGCLIGQKNGENSFEIFKKLKYNVTSVENKKVVSNKLRIIYLRELGLMDNRYNINDIRFWDSNVWK